MTIPDPLGPSLTTLVSHNITINDFFDFSQSLVTRLDECQ